MSLNIQAQPFDFWKFRDKQNSQKENPVKFDYRVNFEYNLDNREFDVGKNLYTNSMTINAARLTPQIGFKVNDKSMTCLLYTSPSPRDVEESRMPSSA